MSAAEIDIYLRELDEPKRSTLQQLRRTILGLLPDAEQGLSCGVPERSSRRQTRHGPIGRRPPVDGYGL